MKIERKNKVVAFEEIEDVIGTCFSYHDMVFYDYSCLLLQ